MTNAFHLSELLPILSRASLYLTIVHICPDRLDVPKQKSNHSRRLFSARSTSRYVILTGPGILRHGPAGSDRIRPREYRARRVLVPRMIACSLKWNIRSIGDVESPIVGALLLVYCLIDHRTLHRIEHTTLHHVRRHHYLFFRSR
jgi:hypothetical protein